MSKIDEKEYFNMFALRNKVSTHPENLTRKEKKRLKELGISV